MNDWVKKMLREKVEGRDGAGSETTKKLAEERIFGPHRTKLGSSSRDS
jgi:hypothetical protein